MNDKMKILVVDDEEINVIILEQLLLSRGYRVIKAFNGVEALKKTKEEAPDLILLDIVMPEMNGYELTEKIRQVEGSSKTSIPIIAVTASDFDLTKERAKSLGFNGYMLKPFETEVLKKKLISIVDDGAL